MNILKVPKDPSMGTRLDRTHEISSFFPQHENEAINWKLLFRAFYWYKSSHFAKTKNIFLKTMILRLKSRKNFLKNIFHLVNIRVYVASSEIWFCRNITRENARDSRPKKCFIASKESHTSIKFYMCYIQCNFKYASPPNLHFCNLQCSSNLCTKTFCMHWPQAGHIAYHSFDKCTSYCYSQKNSCVRLTEEAILGQAASSLQQEILDH